MMQRYLLLLILVLIMPVYGLQQRQDATELAESLANLINIEEPIFLELRTGEWTSSLDVSLREALLTRGADLRENTGSLHSPVYLTDPDDQEAADTQSLLEQYNLETASLVSITMDIGWLTVEHKGFLSYRQERKPVYNFTIKQIELPSNRLMLIQTISFERTGTAVESSSRLRWYEPVFASLALASMIYLLWTTE